MQKRFSNQIVFIKTDNCQLHQYYLLIMPKEDFQIKGPLGKGSFGSVVKCVRISDGEVYAMKQIKLQKLKDKDKLNALNEIRFLASIQHPHVISYKEAFYDEATETLCVVMQFANEGDLDGKVKKNLKSGARFNQKQIWKVAYQTLEGLAKLHDCNIIHRDIKAANVFFDDGNVKIGDLNVAKHLKDQFTATQTGTPYFASPQVWNQQPYDYKSDIWSLGCVLYEMTMLKPPFRAQTAQKLYKKILTGVYQKLSSIYTKKLGDFIGLCLTVDQKERPTARQLLDLPIMKQFKDGSQFLDCQQDLLMGTIKFPNNLKALNSNLPKPNYQNCRPKTLKIIETEQNFQSKTKIGIPSLKNIKSQKKIGLNIELKTDKKTEKSIVPKPRVLGKVASQKLIF